MNTEFAAFTAAASNPFMALMSPELVVAAYERLSIRVAGTVYRPLDKPRLLRAGQEALAAADAEVDANTLDDIDNPLDSLYDTSDIVSATYDGFIQLPA